MLTMMTAHRSSLCELVQARHRDTGSVCVSPEYHQTREQLRPTMRSASTLCLIAQRFREKDGQSSNVTGVAFCKVKELPWRVTCLVSQTLSLELGWSELLEVLQ
jgi:hypothetical protein